MCFVMDGSVKKQLPIVAFLYFGELSVGYIAGWTAPALSKLQKPDETPLSSLISDEESSLLGSFTFFGVIVGAQISGCLSNVKGRKPCLLLGGITLMTAHLLLATSVELWMLFGGRLLLGLGGGMVFIVNMAYIAEVSSKNIRGMLLTGIGIANASGGLIGYTIGPYVSFAALSYVGLAIAMIFTSGVLFLIPESPVFYAITGKEIKAKTTLVLLGRSEDIEDVLSSKITTSRKQEWKSIYSIKSNRKAMVIATVLLVCQQTGGFSCVVFFGTSIFQSAGFMNPDLATIIIGMTQFIGSCITPLFVEKLGRKILMLVTTAVCFVSLVSLGIYFYVQLMNPYIASQMYWLPLLSLMAFILSYTIGFGIIPGTWMSEMFDSAARGPGSASAMTISWVFGFLASSSFGYMTSTLGNHWTFWIYSVSCAIAFVFSGAVVPETKGKSLTEIQYMLSK